MTSPLFQHPGNAPLTSTFWIVLPVFLLQMDSSPVDWAVHPCVPLVCPKGDWFCFLFGSLPTFCLTISQCKDLVLDIVPRIRTRRILASTFTLLPDIVNCNHVFGPGWKKKPPPPCSRREDVDKNKVALSLFHYGQAEFNLIGKTFFFFLYLQKNGCNIQL